MEIYDDSRVGMSDCVSYKKYTPLPKTLNPPTQNAGCESTVKRQKKTQAMISTWNRLQCLKFW